MHLCSPERNLDFQPLVHGNNPWVLKDNNSSLVCISANTSNILLSAKSPQKYFGNLEMVCSLKVGASPTRYLRMNIM